MSEGSKNLSFRIACGLSLFLVIALASRAAGPPIDRAPTAHELQALKNEIQRLQLAGREDEALAALDRLFRLDPQHPKAIGALVDFYKTSLQFDVAEQELRSRVESGPALSYGLGLLEFFKRNYGDSVERFRAAVDGYRALEHLPGQASSHQFLGNALRARGSAPFDEYAAEFNAARALFEQIGDLSAVAEVLNRLSHAHRRSGRNEEALTLARQAVSYAERAEDLVAQGRAWTKVGQALEAAGLPGEARGAFDSALTVQRRGGERVGEALTHKRIALTYIRNGQDPRAEDHLLETIRLAESTDYTDLAAETKILLADHYVEVGRRPEAVKLYRRCLANPEALLKSWMAPRARHSLGRALLELGELQAARDELQLALEAALKIHGKWLEAHARTSLSQVLIATGSQSQALLHQERALEIYRALPNRRADELAALNNLGLIYFRMGMLAQAKQHLDEGLGLAAELSDTPMEALLRYNLSLTLADEGLFDEALDQQRRAMALREEIDDPRQIALSRLNAASTLWQTGDRGQAHAELQLALDGFRDPLRRDVEGEAMALRLQADFLREQGRREDALTAYDEVVEIAREFQSQDQLWLAHAGRADVLRTMDRVGEALEEYDRALDGIESLRGRLESGEFKMRYLASVADVYYRAITLQVASEAQPAARAFHTVERAGARSLSDLLAESRTMPRPGLPAELADREKELIDRVGAAYNRLTQTKDVKARTSATATLAAADRELQSFKVEIRRSAPQYADVVYPRPSRLEEIQQDVLRDGETLLRYFVSDTRAMVWVIDRKQARLHELPHPDELARLVGELVGRAGKPGVRLGEEARRKGHARAEALGRILLVSKPPTDHRLVVVPDGPLHYLPFEALRFDDRYLIEDHEVVTVPSATILSLMRNHPAEIADGGFLGIGDTLPSPEDPRFGPLPFSGQALDRIAHLFPAGRAVLLTGGDATKEKLLQEMQTRFRFVHFATHGWLDPELPRYYGLILSPGSVEGNAEVLSLDDVFALRLASELVVLSACQSGLGEQLRGEGLVGLTRGFLYAGARSLIVSLWSVNDRSTAEFMEAFYGELAEGRTIPGALRQAKLGFLSSDVPARRDPYRWAPFILVGDPGQTPIVLNPASARIH